MFITIAVEVLIEDEEGEADLVIYHLNPHSIQYMCEYSLIPEHTLVYTANFDELELLHTIPEILNMIEDAERKYYTNKN